MRLTNDHIKKGVYGGRKSVVSGGTSLLKRFPLRQIEFDTCTGILPSLSESGQDSYSGSNSFGSSFSSQELFHAVSSRNLIMIKRNNSILSQEPWGKKYRGTVSKGKQEQGNQNYHWNKAFEFDHMEKHSTHKFLFKDFLSPESNSSSESNPFLLDLADKTFQKGWEQFIGDNYMILNTSNGKELIIKAMREGSLIARGFCFANGWELRQDHKIAFSIFSSCAIHKGDSNGMALKAYCYLNGNGVYTDPNEAMIWLSRAVKLKNNWARGMMGLCYLNGEGVQRDEQQAYELYRDSAEQGYVGTMYELGRMYEAGSSTMDIPPDVEEGMKWFREASKQNHPESKQKIDEWEKNPK